MLLRAGTELASWPFEGDGRVGLTMIDELARMQLAAIRLGCSLRLRDVCPELWELLGLTGLTVEVGGEPEGGEEVGVDERVEPRDPPA
ncbi:MAG: hypothetical protein JWO68_2185 [Actinomycetia bacterium]|nr:hypothetical protein [Actinomycetes bacterium]